jgi:protein tyrosine phosphatase (PTP) superfamily phosphohydrolase (DUF442 family)
VFENDKPAPKVDLQKPDTPTNDPSGPTKADSSAATKPVGAPVGIAKFSRVNDLASGLRPSLDDGLDWLRDNGFKTVVFLRGPGDADHADRKQVENRWMKFVSMEVTPQGLNKKLFEEFAALASERGNQPLFVYDTDGARTGALWYLYFRVTQKASSENARNQARGLGLREEQGALHQELWDSARRLAEELREEQPQAEPGT